jgi:SAM-dependent methyltransferase
MSEVQGYVLGQSSQAFRRLEIQDAHFADVSERLLDELAIRPQDRVVELGCGPGGFSRRVLRRLGENGVLVGVDHSEGLLAQARDALAGVGPGRFEPVLADIATLGSWLEGADVVVARTVLHHIPMVEFMLGRLVSRLRPGTRLGFLEPGFGFRCVRGVRSSGPFLPCGWRRQGTTVEDARTDPGNPGSRDPPRRKADADGTGREWRPSRPQ